MVCYTDNSIGPNPAEMKNNIRNHTLEFVCIPFGKLRPKLLNLSVKIRIQPPEEIEMA